MAVDETSYVGFAKDPETGKRHELRHLKEESSWEPGIYQFEDQDKIIGGPDGLDNLPLQELANRTKFLYDANERMYAIIKRLALENAALKKLVPVETVLPVVFAADQPTDGSVWVKPESGRVNCNADASSYITQEDGITFKDAFARIVNDGGLVALVRTNYVHLNAEETVKPDKDNTLGNFRIVRSDDNTAIEYQEGGGANDEIVSANDIDAIFNR